MAKITGVNSNEIETLFKKSFNITKKLMESRNKGDKIKGINLFLKISRGYSVFLKQNPKIKETPDIDRIVNIKLGELLAATRAGEPYR